MPFRLRKADTPLKNNPVKAIQRLAFVVNATKPGAVELAEVLAESASATGAEAKVTTDYPLAEDYLKGMDACCVVGGDGTLLSVAKAALKWHTPVFGINRGKLGFLATYSVEEAQAEFEKLLSGEYQIVTRSVLSCHTPDGESSFALNDTVIKSSDGSRLIGLRVTCGDEVVTDYYSDGLVFCTPTGSTAYNLSAGGPIVMPDAGVLTMTPICPHTLTNRSVVFPHAARLKVELLQSAGQPLLTLDGSACFHGQHFFPFEVGIADQSLLLLQPHAYSHFRILRNKLKWGDIECEH